VSDHDHEVLDLMRSTGTDAEKFAAAEYIAACDDERAVLRKCSVWKKFAELAAVQRGERGGL
jgi:hypothetical protein